LISPNLKNSKMNLRAIINESAITVVERVIYLNFVLKIMDFLAILINLITCKNKKIITMIIVAMITMIRLPVIRNLKAREGPQLNLVLDKCLILHQGINLQEREILPVLDQDLLTKAIEELMIKRKKIEIITKNRQAFQAVVQVEPEKKEVEVAMELEKAVFFEKEAVLKEDLDVEFDCFR